MKRKCVFVSLFFLYFQLACFSQPGSHTPTLIGVFEYAFDKSGNKYPISNLTLGSTKPFGGSSTVHALPSYSCNAGFFNVYFAPGSMFDGASQAAADSRSVVCELLTNISGFIQSPLSAPGNTVRVNLYCENDAGLGSASSMFAFPFAPANPNQGFIDNLIYKTIITGKDAYDEIAMGVFTSANGFYHGYLRANPTPAGGSWNIDMSLSSINVNEYDLYSIMLHEITHALGFASLIGSNGTSVMNMPNFGIANNYFSRYDKFLHSPGGAPLLTTSTPTCPYSNISITPSLTSIIGTATTGCNSDNTNCSNPVVYISSTNSVAVYTPTCFESGSSLSHFEDQCYQIPVSVGCATAGQVSANNNYYFVMSNANGMGNCFIKRYLKNEERNVLCDLGFSLSTTYTSAAASANYSYSAGSCNPSNIIGMNDGYVNGVFTFTSINTTTTIPYSALLANDSPSTGLTVECVELVYNNAILSLGANDLTVTATPGQGLVLLKYLPKNSAGDFGNNTYVYLYFMSPNCNAGNECNMVQNGGFENILSLGDCGFIWPLGVNVSCWDQGSGYPIMFSRNCSFPPYSVNSGANPDTQNGTPNDKYCYLECINNPQVSQLWSRAPKNNLITPLVPGQAYQLSFFAINPWPSLFGSFPVIISVCTEQAFNMPPLLNYPGNNVVAEFTLNPTTSWSLMTTTFTFNPAPNVNHTAFFIGLDPIKTSVQGYQWLPADALIDDVNLVPVPSPTFVVPQFSNCAGVSIYDLAQYASPITGSFSAPAGLSTITTSVGTQYNFNDPPTLQGGKSYPVAFHYTNTSGCVGTVWETILVPGISSSSCDNGYTLAAIGYSTGTTYTWLPSGLNTSVVTVTPTGATVYTLITVNGTCQLTSTISLSPCCSASITQYLPSVLNTTVGGLVAFNHDVTVPGGTQVTLSGPLAFAPGVKLIVPAGGTLQLTDAHLYGCTTSLWNGIEVLDGGKVFTHFENIDNLLEDAVTAISVNNHSTSTLNPILDISRTTFNKNHIDISISNYQRTVSPYPFSIKECVFTSRDLPFTQSTWPQTSLTDLRNAVTATTGIIPPYLSQSNYSVVSARSHIAIKLTNVGVTSSAYYGATFGSTASASDFNLFDSHDIFIDAENSNVTSQNNVFQNTRSFIVTIPGGLIQIQTTEHGRAIDHRATGLMNMKLDLGASDVNTGNRFWNCQTAIWGDKIYNFNISKGIFRSTQASTLLVGPNYIPPGHSGINLNTNRFLYSIADCEFTNINNCINVPISAGQFTPAPPGCSTCTNGVLAGALAIVNNTFGPQTSTSTAVGNNYLGSAVNISCPNSVPFFTTPDYTIALHRPPIWNLINWYLPGTLIYQNKVDRALRGININGFNGPGTHVLANKINLYPDNVYSQPQYGISQSNCLGAANAYASFSIKENTLSAQSSTNSLTTLVKSSQVKGLYSPNVICNNLKDAFQGFQFDSYNTPTVNLQGAFWRSNDMESLGRGLVLTNGGFMGVQGSSVTLSANRWNGSWSVANGTISTFIGSNSSATNAPMWVANTSSTYPSANTGAVFNANWYGTSASTSVSAGGSFECLEPSNSVGPFTGGDVDYANSAVEYIVKTGLYRFLHVNDSVKESDAQLETFYDDLSESNIALFVQIEEELYEGDHSTAGSILASMDIDEENPVEINYAQFYQLYINYLSGLDSDEDFSATDSVSLLELSSQCPGLDGACIYQARALYNTIYMAVVNSPVCEEETEARKGNTENNESSFIISKTELDPLKIYPNPAGNHLMIESTEINKFLHIKIKDVTGRIVMEKELKIVNNTETINLDLINGMYILTISDDKDEKAIKKLLISK